MPQSYDDMFENTFFEASAPGRTRRASVATTDKRTELRFTTAKAHIRGVTITPTERGYIVRTAGRQHIAFSDLRQYLMADNRVDLKFSDELMAFEPGEDLIKKSKVPLWVVKPLGEGTVAIERVWSA